MDIRVLLKKIREEHNYSVAKMGEIIGAAGSLVNQIETGRRNITENYINKVISAFPVYKKDITEAYYLNKVKNITETDTGYSIDMIFDHRMEPNYNLSIKYEGNRFKKSLEGIYKIIRVEHDLSALNNSFTSKIELEDSLKSIQTKEKNENYPKEIKIEI